MVKTSPPKVLYTTVSYLAVDALFVPRSTCLLHFLDFLVGFNIEWYNNSVHDPAWWWVKASNLETPSGVVVRFNLAHVPDLETPSGVVVRFNPCARSGP